MCTYAVIHCEKYLFRFSIPLLCRDLDDLCEDVAEAVSIALSTMNIRAQIIQLQGSLSSASSRLRCGMTYDIVIQLENFPT